MLEDARARGFLGPGPVTAHVTHAHGLAAAVPEPPATAVDLGSGAGIPGLVLAGCWPESRWVLLEAGDRRARFLETAVERLALGDRVAVRAERAEVAGRDPALRGQCDLVTARAFGPPATTAECASPLLLVGGRLLVTEPPDAAAGTRWPNAGLAVLGLGVERTATDPNVVLLRQVERCPDRFPRRVGMPAKRPLF